MASPAFSDVVTSTAIDAYKGHLEEEEPKPCCFSFRRIFCCLKDKPKAPPATSFGPKAKTAAHVPDLSLTAEITDISLSVIGQVPAAPTETRVHVQVSVHVGYSRSLLTQPTVPANGAPPQPVNEALANGSIFSLLQPAASPSNSVPPPA